MRDASRLYNLFRVTLNYDLFYFTNCSRDDIFKAIADIRQHIKENGCYDRLVFVISTHGDEVYLILYIPVSSVKTLLNNDNNYLSNY